MSTEPTPGTQNARALAWARKGNALFQDDWYGGGPDGLGPVTSIRTRVSELQRLGFAFSRKTRAGHTMLEYRLVAETGVEQPRAAGDAEVDEQLALPSADPARVGHYDCWA